MAGLVTSLSLQQRLVGILGILPANYTGSLHISGAVLHVTGPLFIGAISILCPTGLKHHNAQALQLIIVRPWRICSNLFLLHGSTYGRVATYLHQRPRQRIYDVLVA